LDRTQERSADVWQSRVTRTGLCQKASTCNQHSLDHPDLDQGLVFLGLQGMIDPPRPEAIGCACLSVSGYSGEDDHWRHALTAGAIAR